MNESDIHIDFMIGSPELTVTGSPATASACRCSSAAPGRFRRSRSAALIGEPGRAQVRLDLLLV